jgi:ferredoxin
VFHQVLHRARGLPEWWLIPAAFFFAGEIFCAKIMTHGASLDESPDASPSESYEVTLVTPYGARVIRARASEHIWDAAKNAGIALPAICHQGRCLTCAGQLLEPGEFDPSDAVSYFPQDREAGFILLCTAKPRSNLRIRTHVQTEMRQYRLKCGLPAPYA